MLDEVVFLMELVPPSGSPMGEFALNTVTGAYLRDDRGQKIRILDTGQLIDPMGWALIGADARPLWWREDIYAYTDHKGRLLGYGAGDTLIDANGFVAHSVISNVIAGTRIYLFYLADGISLIPVTLKTISTEPYVADYYDMNGKKIDLNEIIEPEISVDDRKENWPDEFLSGWDKFVAFLKKAWTFLKQWGLLILIGFALLLTSPIWFPLLLTVLPIICKAILNGLKAVGKGLLAVGKAIIFIFTLPFRRSKDKD